MTRPDSPEVAGRLRVPADVDRPDTLLAGLTARQLAVLAGAGLVAYTVIRLSVGRVPLPVVAALTAPVAVLALTLLLARSDGLAGDRLAWAALRHTAGPRRLVPTTGGPVPTTPGWARGVAGPAPAALRLPIRSVAADGVVDLGADGAAVICRASAVTFSLRSPAEQQALLTGYARHLNALAGPVQILLRAEPADLSVQVARLLEGAGGLPHPALEMAARDHARYLQQLTTDGMVLARGLFVVFHDPMPQGAGERLTRRARDAAGELAAAGITLTLLDGPQTAVVLAAAVDPHGPAQPASLTGPHDVITGMPS